MVSGQDTYLQLFGYEVPQSNLHFLLSCIARHIQHLSAHTHTHTHTHTQIHSPLQTYCYMCVVANSVCTSILSSRAGGMVADVLAVAMNKTLDKSNGRPR